MALINKTTPLGKAIRTFIQAAIGILGFMIGLVAIPGVYDYLSQSPVFAGGSLAMTIAVVTYIYNFLEKVWAYLNEPYEG